MIAGGAQLGSLGADHDVTAVAALPDLDLGLLKDLSSLDVLQQSAVTLLVCFSMAATRRNLPASS